MLKGVSNMFEEDREKICCFVGQRPDKLLDSYYETRDNYIKLKIRLAIAIEEMRGKGVTTFMSGMDMGTDIWCAEIVLDLKRAYPDEVIRLIAVVPYENQAVRWTEKYRERYFDILARCDAIVTLQVHFSKDCIYKRCCYMVNSSAHLIVVNGGERAVQSIPWRMPSEKGWIS
jgi:uncharacterized phage-like protein YoqJ